MYQFAHQVSFGQTLGCKGDGKPLPVAAIRYDFLRLWTDAPGTTYRDSTATNATKGGRSSLTAKGAGDFLLHFEHVQVTLDLQLPPKTAGSGYRCSDDASRPHPATLPVARCDRDDPAALRSACAPAVRLLRQTIAGWGLAAVVAIFCLSPYQFCPTGLQPVDLLTQCRILGFRLCYAFLLCHGPILSASAIPY